MAIVPTLWLDPASLELRLNSLVAEEFRRPVLERLVAQRAPTAPEAFPERILVFVEELAKILEPSSAWLDAHLWVAATREIVPCDPPSSSHHRVELHWPAEVSVDDLARWLNTSANDPSYAKNLTRLLHEFGQTDWAAIERLFSDAWRRNTMGPDAAPETVAKAAFRATFARITLTFTAKVCAAFKAFDADRNRKMIALDAGQIHHSMLSGMRDLPKTREVVKARVVSGWAEIMTPVKQVGLRLDTHEIPTRLIDAVREWRSWHGLRHWAALQYLFTSSGRTGRIRWMLQHHLDALGYSDRARRDPEVRDRVAAEVEALTRIEIAIYNKDGSVRVRGPILAITQRGESLRGTQWALEGLELMIHPVLYEGVRAESGELGSLWAPAPAELARIDHVRHPHALALGLILPIRWRWDALDGQAYLDLTGKHLLEAAGIRFSAHDSKRAWTALQRDLDELQRIGGIGGIEWISAPLTLGGVCRLHPPQWFRDRILHSVQPAESQLAFRVLTGSDLETWRKSRGFTQEDLADRLGLSLRTVQRAEQRADFALPWRLQKALLVLR